MRYFLIFSLFFIPFFSFAQTGNPFSVEAIPENPGPHEQVFLSLSSFSFDINRATISWTVDGKRIKSGIGEKAFSFTTGDVGVLMRITVGVSVPGDKTYSQTLSFRAGEVDILWEAVDSYTPPFYKGKAIPAARSVIRATAIPNLRSGGINIKASTAVYKWKLNNKYSELNDQSGYGKQTVVFRNGILNLEENLAVEVSSLNGSLGGTNNITIERKNPEILFYEKDPLRGIVYENTIKGDYIPKGTELLVSAEPYFFSDYNPFSQTGFTLEWLLNNKAVSYEGSPREAGFVGSREGPSGGTVSLEVRNKDQILQFARNSFRLLFKQNNAQ